LIHNLLTEEGMHMQGFISNVKKQQIVHVKDVRVTH